MPELTPVQGIKYTDGYKSVTELARGVAAHSGWCFDENEHLVDADGTVIADRIEDAAEAMSNTGWITADPDGVETAIYWSQLPDSSEDRADAIRAALKPSQR